MNIMKMSLRRPVIPIMMLVVLLALSACPYTSKVPLSSPDEAKIDPELIGTWVFTDEQDKIDHEIPFFAFNEHEYLIVIHDGKETAYFRAFTTDIEGRKFLNYQELNSSGVPGDYGFLFYKVENDVLYLRTLEDDLIDRQFDSSEALCEQVRKNIDNEKLYDDFAVFKRLHAAGRQR